MSDILKDLEDAYMMVDGCMSEEEIEFVENTINDASMRIKELEQESQ